MIMRTQNLFVHCAFGVLIALVSGCVGESVVVVSSSNESDLEQFSPGGTVEKITGGTGVKVDGEIITGKAGSGSPVSGSTGVYISGRKFDTPIINSSGNTGPFRVVVEDRVFYKTESSGVDGLTGVTIAEDPAEREIRDGGIDFLTNNVAVAVMPPPQQTGDNDSRIVQKQVYVELMRQLVAHGCRLASGSRAALRRPANIENLYWLAD